MDLSDDDSQESDFDPEGGGSDDERNSGEEASDIEEENTLKRKREESGGKTAKKGKLDASAFFEDQAEESDDEDGNRSDDDDEEEDKDNYEADDFVVFDDDDEESNKKGRKEKERKVLQRLKKKSESHFQLDVEDYELIQDNQQLEEAASEVDENEIQPEETGEIRPERYDDYDSDDMADFIEDDEVDGMPAGDTMRRAAPSRPRGISGRTREQIEEAINIFGEGYEDYGDYYMDEEETVSPTARSKPKYDHSALVEIFCTDYDDVLRNTDLPERRIDVMPGRVPPQAAERAQEAIWIAKKLAQKILSTKHNTAYPEGVSELAEALVPSIIDVLRFMQVDKVEVPFIMLYRRDYLHETLTSQHLWLVQSMDEQWEDLVGRRNRILDDLSMIISTRESDGAVLTRSDRERSIQNKQQMVDMLTLEVSDANTAVEEAFNAIEDDDATEEDKQKVHQSQERLQSLQEQLATAEASLEKENESLQKYLHSHSAKMQCTPEIAAEFLDLFPVEKYRSFIESVTDEAVVRDLQQYFNVLYHGCMRQSSKKMRSENYILARKNPLLREFIKEFSLSAAAVGYSIRFDSKMDAPTPLVDVSELAKRYASQLNMPEHVLLQSVKCILATEIACEPLVRRAARAKYFATATISTSPTEEGRNIISPFHELFGLHFIEKKPLHELLHAVGADRYMFLKLLKGQTEGLLNITFAHGDVSVFLHDVPLMNMCLPSRQGEYTSVQEDWDNFRMQVLGDCLEKYLLPSLEVEAKRELLKTAREAVIEESCEKYRSMLSMGPYRLKAIGWKDVLKACPQRGCSYSVVSIFVPSSNREPTEMVFVDSDGVLRAQESIPFEVKHEKREKIKKFLVSTCPGVVVINAGGGQVSKSLKAMLEKYIVPEVQNVLEENRKNQARLERDDDEDEIIFQPDIVLMRDEIARIFSSSPRAARLLPDIPPATAGAVCLARYVQDPLQELANMWLTADALGYFGHEVLYLDLHPLLELVRSAKAPLLRELQQCVVDAVCRAGVDINRCVQHDHFAGALAFVSGLGLRKADAIRQSVKTQLGHVSSRKQFIERKLVGPVVYNNSVGFLRVFGGEHEESAFDPLDNTRIHPECYITNDFAIKICASALEMEYSTDNYYKVVNLLMKHCKKEFDKTLRLNPQWVEEFEYTGVLAELNDKMSDLVLDEFAKELEAAGLGKRYHQLCQIKNELRFPYLDSRTPIKEPTIEELYTLLTGENDDSLHVGMRVTAKVVELRDKSANVVIDGGMRGFVRISNIVPRRVDVITDVISVGQVSTAVVLAVNKEQCKVEVSLKEEHVMRGEDWWLANRNLDANMRMWWNDTKKRFDNYFNESKALAEYRETEARRDEQAKLAILGDLTSQMKSASVTKTTTRVIYHPSFKNCSYQRAEEELRGKGDGEVIIRPSSKGPNALSITWAVQEGWYKHIEMTDEDRAEGQGIGKKIYIKGDADVYADLDEVISRYIEPMNDFVRQMKEYRCFRDLSKEEAETYMKNQWKENAGRIPYLLRFEKQFPGYFVLSWMASPEGRPREEFISVKPEGYKIRDRKFTSPSALIQWFKQMAIQSAQQPAPPAPAPTQHVPRRSRFTDANPILTNTW